MNRELNPKMLLLCGLPGSGKSTERDRWLAEDPKHRQVINYDDLRDFLYGPFWKWNRKEEDEMKAYALNHARSLLELGCSVVIDNCNLNDRARAPWMKLAAEFGVAVEIFEIDTPLEECIRRDAKREGKRRVGRAVIERMALFNGFIDWNDRTKYPRDFIIVDMDGTVADCDWRRKLAFEGPTRHAMSCNSQNIIDRQCPECGGKAQKNWGLFYRDVEKDPPIKPIVDLVAYLNQTYHVIVVSGRPTDEAGKGTEEWLRDKPFGVTHLFMRNAMDYRPDDIIKQEILDLLPKDRIKYVFDDRERVVQMWRRNGLTCLQVADGRF